MKATHKTTAAIAAALLLAALVTVASLWAFRQIETTAAERKQSGDILNLADDWFSELRDAESGQRGFALTGDESFLQPYLAVKDKIAGHLQELRALTMSAAARQRLDAITPLQTAKLAQMSRVIELRRHQDMPAVLAAVKSGEGRQLMDAIRAEMKVFLQIEEGERAQHNADFQSNMRILFVIIVVASLLALLA